MSNSEGKMKEKKKLGALKFMGFCFSSHESSLQTCQKYQHLQENELEQFPKNHNAPQGGGGQVAGRWSPVSTSSSGEASQSENKSPKFFYTPKDVKELRQNPGYSLCDIFTFEELKLATKHFRPDLILGEGGFGVVYRGAIDESVRPGYKNIEVAIKQLNPNGYQGDREWLAEVSYLGQLSHPNLVKLVGYCCEDEHRLLVYEYMASGCLEKHLFRRMSATLTWLRRLKIALDAAKGLAFLHGLDQPIIYRDFKTSNILLDSNFNAKLSDFGLAKLGPMGDQSHVSTRVMGTYGYAAPEYILTGHLTARSDVYGFGVVLLEMLIGRRALDKSRPSREHNLVEWCRPLLNSKKFLRILDARIDGQYSVKAMTRVAHITSQCLSENPKGRPLMSQVVQILEGIYEQEAGHEMAMLAKNEGRVTLYEAPDHPKKKKTSNNNNNNNNNNNSKSKDGRRSSEREKRELRSRSEPQQEGTIFSLTPERAHRSCGGEKDTAL